MVVIGLVDNILRPLLVGKDTQMPDYIVLMSTIGGMALFGINGFVIGPVIAALFMAAWDLFAASATSRRSRAAGLAASAAARAHHPAGGVDLHDQPQRIGRRRRRHRPAAR